MSGHCISPSYGYFTNVSANQTVAAGHMVLCSPMRLQSCLCYKWCQSIAGRRTLTGDSETFVSTYYDKLLLTNDITVYSRAIQCYSSPDSPFQLSLSSFANCCDEWNMSVSPTRLYVILIPLTVENLNPTASSLDIVNGCSQLKIFLFLDISGPRLLPGARVGGMELNLV